jgi:nucleotide-binding universal stress UspA family protein
VETPSSVVPDGPLVIGVDESEGSRDAIALGQQLAEDLAGGQLPVYVHTLQELDALMTGHNPEEVEELVAEHAKAKHAQVRALAAEMGVSEVHVRQATSSAAGLHDQVGESNAALVVIGSSSRSGLGRVLPGGTAERLLSGAPVPVAVAPNGYAGRKAAHEVIGVGFDQSPESRKAVGWAAALASRSGASLRLFAVYAPLAFGNVSAGGALGMQTVDQVLAKERQVESEELAGALSAEVSAESHSFRGDPAKVLVEQSQRLGLLVLGSRGYGPLKSVLRLMGSHPIEDA